MEKGRINNNIETLEKNLNDAKEEFYEAGYQKGKEDMVATYPKRQSGTYNCPTNVKLGQTVRAMVNFPAPFASVPHMSINVRDTSNDYAGQTYGGLNVTKVGFSVNLYNKIKETRVSIDWIAWV